MEDVNLVHEMGVRLGKEKGKGHKVGFNAGLPQAPLPQGACWTGRNERTLLIFVV